VFVAQSGNLSFDFNVILDQAPMGLFYYDDDTSKREKERKRERERERDREREREKEQELNRKFNI